VIAPARRMAFEVLSRIDRGGTFSDEALNSPALLALDRRDRSLVAEIVYGTLRSLAELNHVLKGASSIAWDGVEPGIKTLLQMSLYQLWRLDRIPHHAVVNDAVGLAKRVGNSRGAAGFVNGVLRSLSRTRPWCNEDFDRRLPEWVAASLPEWLWYRWASRYGSQAAAEYAKSLCEKPTCAYWCRAPGERNDGECGDSIPSDVVPGAQVSQSSTRGSGIWVQDEASQLIPHLFGPCAGWRVWDACACPGGKTALLISGTGRSGAVASSDRSKGRVRRMSQMLRDFYGERPSVLVADASVSPPFRVEFDAVLADVPCSGLGTLRRNPEIKWKFKPEQLLSIQSQQAAILASVAKAVRPKGLLLYSTCSTEPEENELVVDAFLARNPAFRLVRPAHPPGIDRWLDHRGLLRTFPDTRLWDGFFAALMIRNS